MKLRKFTSSGIERFNEYLDLLQTEPARLVPVSLLEDPSCSEIFGAPTDIEGRTFENRYAAAEWLEETLAKTGVLDVERDVGLWAWLALFFFDELCPPKRATGERQLRERAAYVPEPQNFQRYYRHLLLGPYLIFRAHRDYPERAMALLCKPLPIIDDVVAQLASRQEFVTNRALVELATRLYYDPASHTTKRGARKRRRFAEKVGGCPATVRCDLGPVCDGARRILASLADRVQSLSPICVLIRRSIEEVVTSRSGDEVSAR